MDVLQQQAAGIAQKAGAITATGSGLVGWLTDYADAIAAGGVIIGIMLGLAGFAVKTGFDYAENRRRKEAHRAHMDNIIYETRPKREQ